MIRFADSWRYQAFQIRLKNTPSDLCSGLASINLVRVATCRVL
jgi:hypothetical protein